MKISEMIQELQEILNTDGDLEIFEEQLDFGENTGLWYSLDPVVRYKEKVNFTPGYIELPDKFVSLE
jgi:hypothetical protein